MRWNLLVVLALFGAVAVQANLPDLALIASPGTAWAALGRQAVFSVRVSNFGNSFSGRTQLAATFPDGLSVSPSLSSVPALLAGRSAAFSFTVTCVKQGAYSPSFVVDPRNSIAELNENNNAASVSVTCGELPDLGVAITPRASQPLSYDEAAAFNVTTLNFGRVNAGQSATVVAYSGFTGGLLIQPATPAYLPIAQLAPGGKSLVQFKLTCRIPGVYFLNAYADIAKAVRESNENNNDDGVKVTCAGFPDLNATISPRANLTLSYDKANLFNVTTLNFGKSPAGQSATLVDYSGPKEGLWILPLTPAYLPVPRLAPGANSVSGLYVTCRLPGVYSLFGLADVKNVVSESDEANNNDTLVLNCASPPSPDLVSRISPRSQSAFVGQVVPVVLTTSNVGNGSAGRSVTTLQLGAGATQFYYLPALGPGQSVVNASFNGTFTCYRPGNFTLVSSADALGQVMESDELNNNDSIVIACVQPALPDLVTNFSTHVLNLVVGQSASATVTTRNVGKASSGASDTAVTGGAGLPYFVRVPALKAGEQFASLPLNFTCTRPGVFYPYAVADYSKVVSESDEANNNDTLVLNCASPPSPDLVSRISPRFQTVFVGQDMPVSVATSNVGNAPAGNSAVTLQVGAVGGKLFFYIPPLAPNQSVTNATFNGTFTCYTPGNYTVASFADALGQVSESDESNNGGSAIIACLKRQVPNPTPPDPIPVPMTPSPEPGGQRMG